MRDLRVNPKSLADLFRTYDYKKILQESMTVRQKRCVSFVSLPWSDQTNDLHDPLGIIVMYRYTATTSFVKLFMYLLRSDSDRREPCKRAT